MLRFGSGKRMTKSQMRKEISKMNQEFIDDLEKSGQKVGIEVQPGQQFRKITRREK